MDYELNDHNKSEYPPAHTAEHLLNQTMIRIFGCERSYNAHVERKKSKMSFYLDHMCIIAPLTAENADHRLIQQVLRSMCWRIL